MSRTVVYNRNCHRLERRPLRTFLAPSHTRGQICVHVSGPPQQRQPLLDCWHENRPLHCHVHRKCHTKHTVNLRRRPIALRDAIKLLHDRTSHEEVTAVDADDVGLARETRKGAQWLEHLGRKTSLCVFPGVDGGTLST